MSGGRLCWQEITVLLKAVSPNACEPAGFNLWGGVSLCTCTHACFLTSVGVLQISMRKEIQRLSFQNSCLMLFQMACDLLNITIAFQAGGRRLHREEKIIFVFLKKGLLFCQLRCMV